MSKYLGVILLSLPFTISAAINYHVKFTNFSKYAIKIYPSRYNSCIKQVSPDQLIKISASMSTNFILTDSNNWLSHCYFAAKMFTWNISYANSHDQLILKHWEYGSWLTNLQVLHLHTDGVNLSYSIRCNNQLCQGQYDYLGDHDISIKVAILDPKVYQCKIPSTNSLLYKPTIL